MRRVLLASAVLAAAFVISSGADAQPAPAPSPVPAAVAVPTGPLHVVMHIDVAPGNAAVVEKALQGYVADARKEDGNLRVELVKESVGDSYMLLEMWRDQAAYDVHTSSPPIVRLRFAAQPLLVAPYDIRRARQLADK